MSAGNCKLFRPAVPPAPSCSSGSLPSRAPAPTAPAAAAAGRRRTLHCLLLDLPLASCCVERSADAAFTAALAALRITKAALLADKSLMTQVPPVC